MQLLTTANDVGRLIAMRGKGWWNHYAQRIDKQQAGSAIWLAEDDTKKVSFFQANNYITVPELAARVSAAVGKQIQEEDDTVLRVLSAEYVDRYDSKFIIGPPPGMTTTDFNGVVVDTHQMWTCKDITGRCIGLFPFEMPDGTAGLASLTQYPRHSPENIQMLALDKWGGIPSQSIGAFIDAYEMQNENGDTEIEPGDKSIQVMTLWQLYHYAPCPIPGQPNATTYQAAQRSIFNAAIKAGVLHTNDALVRASTGKASKSFFEQPRAAAVPVTPKSSQSFDNDLNILLSQLSISSSSKTKMDPKLVEFLRSVAALPATSAEIRTAIEAALRDGGMSKTQTKHAAKLAEAADAMEGHLTAAAKAHETVGDHMDKADAMRMEISKRAKALAGDKEEPDGDEKPDDKKPAEGDKPDDKKEESLSLRERVRKQS